MDYRIDEKGKVFTTHVTKRGVNVVAQVGSVIVQGTVYLTLDNRLKDELNGGEAFIAVTSASVRDHATGTLQYETEVLLLNKAHLDWMFPQEEA